MEFDSAIFYSNDLERTINFYSKIIGLKIEYQQGNKYVSFKFPNEVRLGIKTADSNREIPGSQTIIIAIKNIDDIYKRLKEQNVPMYLDITNESWGRTFSILDPDNNRIEFLKRN